MRVPRSPWFLIVLLSLASLPVSAGDDDKWRTDLRDALKRMYPITERSHVTDSTTHPGVILIVKKEGIKCSERGRGTEGSKDLMFSSTYIRDGNVEQIGGLKGMFLSKKNEREFKAGDKVYATDIDVTSRNYVVFWLLSAEMFDVTERGTTRPARFAAMVGFGFTREWLQTATPEQVKAAIDPVLQTAAEMSAPQTKTIGLGQTREQVEAALGRPERVVELGAKVMYVYKDMKVVFVDGKVTDVQ